MADNVTIPASGTGTATPVVATDDVGGAHYQRVKVDLGGDGAASPLVRGQQSGANSLPVVLASDQGAVPITDNAGSLTVDGTVAVSGTVTVDSELTTADLDLGAGSDTRAVVGLVGAKSGGGQLIPGDATAGLKVDLGADNDVTVTSGTITTITNVVHVDDNAGSLTVDNGGTFAVQVSSQPARAATTDTITAKLATDAIHSGTTALTPKFAAIAAASAGDNTLVAAVVGKKIRVLSLFVLAASAVNVYFTSAAGGTVIFGGSTNKITLAANGGFVLPFSPVGWFENSAANQALVLNLSGAVAVSGGLVYVEV